MRRGEYEAIEGERGTKETRKIEEEIKGERVSYRWRGLMREID